MKIEVVKPSVLLITQPETLNEMIRVASMSATVSRGEPKEDEFTIDSAARIARCLDKKPFPHDTILEHGCISFLMECSRSTTHQLVRHRHTAFTQQSTRYCVPSAKKRECVRARVVVPMDGSIRPGVYEMRDGLRPWIRLSMISISLYEEACSAGYANEEARKMLPHCLSSMIMMTPNLSQFRHFLAKRLERHASPEIRYLAYKAYKLAEDVSAALVYGVCVPEDVYELVEVMDG